MSREMREDTRITSSIMEIETAMDRVRAARSALDTYYRRGGAEAYDPAEHRRLWHPIVKATEEYIACPRNKASQITIRVLFVSIRFSRQLKK